jgi:hypothetical protein
MTHAANTHVPSSQAGLICVPRPNAGAKWPCVPSFG